MLNDLLENVLQNKMLVSELAQSFRASPQQTNAAAAAAEITCNNDDYTVDCDDVYNEIHDGPSLYRLFAERRLPWSKVNQNKIFLYLWWQTPEDTRRALLHSTPHFTKQLDVDNWTLHLLQRDDVNMLVSLPAPQAEKVMRVLVGAMVGVAPRCFRAVLRRSPAVALERMNAAAKAGDLPRMRLMHKKACPWNETTCAAAAAGGHLECLEFARSEGCAWDAWTCVSAAANGHLACLQFALQGGCVWFRKTSLVFPNGKEKQFAGGRWIDVADGEHLVSVERAKEIGYQWPGMVCHWAAVHGHFDCLVAARAHGLPWSGDDAEPAARSIEF